MKRLALAALSSLLLVSSADAACRKFCLLEQAPSSALRSATRDGVIDRNRLARELDSHIAARDLCLKLTGDVKCRKTR